TMNGQNQTDDCRCKPSPTLRGRVPPLPRCRRGFETAHLTAPRPQCAGLSGEKSSGGQGKEFACQFRLGRACPVGLQPTDLIRGHPRLETVETKTWIRGSSPRKTTSTRFLGVLHKLALQGYFPPTAPRLRGEGRGEGQRHHGGVGTPC